MAKTKKSRKTSDLTAEEKKRADDVVWERDAGRPSKIGEFTKQMEEVLNNGMDALICTDEELIMLVNEKLDDEDKIAEDTFKTWKNEGIKDERCLVFRHLIKKALLQQKRNLFTKLNDQDRNDWTRYAWQIERKFDEWNLKNKNEVTDRRNYEQWLDEDEDEEQE